jgi:hypothetical protein
MPTDFEAAGIVKRAARGRPVADAATFDGKPLDEG